MKLRSKKTKPSASKKRKTGDSATKVAKARKKQSCSKHPSKVTMKKKKSPSHHKACNSESVDGLLLPTLPEQPNFNECDLSTAVG